MAALTIGVLVGSLRRESLNRRLADGLARLAPSATFRQIEIGDLPPYNQDNDADPPQAAKRLKAEIRASDGILFVSPEYNRSVPGVLKNAIDHASRPYGDSAFAGKPAGIIGVSPGASGSAMAQQHLRNIVAYLDMPTLAQPEAFIQAKEGLFNDDGSIGPASHAFAQKWVEAYLAWVRAHSAAPP